MMWVRTDDGKTSTHMNFGQVQFVEYNGLDTLKITQATITFANSTRIIVDDPNGAREVYLMLERQRNNGNPQQ